MRKLLLFTVVCLLVAVDIQGQTTIQQGVTYRYNGKQQRTPLGNVTISYDANKRSTLSNEHDGSFTLLLDGGKMGDRIGLVTVKKREMMVFNQHAVDEWSIRKEPLVLILCNVDEFERQKNNLINIGKREAKKKYDRLKAELEAKLSASQMKQQEYEAALDQAYDELDRFQKNVGEYADLFARIDESEVDTLAQRALDLFNQGKADEAIRLFEQGHYMDKLDKALKNSQQADQLKAVAEQAKEQATQDSLKALQSLKAQIEAYKMNNEWNKAGELLKGLADRLNTVRACWNYAYFCDNQNNFKDSEVYYKRAISILDKQEDKESLDNVNNKASLLNGLAILYKNTQRFTEGESMYKEALEIFRRFAQLNPQAYAPDVALTLNNLAILYKNTQRFIEGEAMYKEALEMFRRLAQSNPQAYDPDVAMTLNNLANLYSDTQRLSESELMYKEALETYCRLAHSNPQAYEPYVAGTLNNQADLYINTQRFTEGEAMYKKALEIRRRLAQSNPQAYDPDVAMTLNNLAILYSDTQRLSESELMYKEALEIRRRLAQFNPQAYDPDVAQTLNNLAHLYQKTKCFSESELMYKEALEIRRRLAQSNPQAYEPYVARTLKNLADLYYKTQRFTEGEAEYKEALEIYHRLAQSNPQAYDPDVAQIQYGIGLLKMDMKCYEEAIPPFEEVLNIDRRIFKTNPAWIQRYENDLNYLNLLYYAVKNYLAVYQLHQEWLPIKKEKYEADPESLQSEYAGNLANHSWCCIFAKQYAEAEQYAREGLAIDSAQYFIYSNLAVALLFQGRYEEAEQIYRQYKDELKNSFLDDFKQFAEAGVIPEERKPDVERIKRLIEE